MVTKKNFGGAGATIPLPASETLAVTAEAAWEIRDGRVTALDPYVIVRVKDQSGDPVTGLKKSNFRVVEMGWGYTTVDLQVSSSSTPPPFQELVDGLVLAGTYSLRLNRSLLDRYGQFVIAVVVTAPGRAASRPVGQALLAVVKLK